MKAVRSSYKPTVPPNNYNGKRYKMVVGRLPDLPPRRSEEVIAASPVEPPLSFPTIGTLLRKLAAAVYFGPQPETPVEPLEILESALGKGNTVHTTFQFNHVKPRDLFQYWTSFRDYAQIYNHFSSVNVKESCELGSRVEFRIRKGPIVIDYEVQHHYDLSEKSRGVYKMHWNLTKEARYIRGYEGTIEFHPCGEGTRVISQQKIETSIPIIQNYLNKNAVQAGRDTAKGMVKWIAKQQDDGQRP